MEALDGPLRQHSGETLTECGVMALSPYGCLFSHPNFVEKMAAVALFESEVLRIKEEATCRK